MYEGVDLPDDFGRWQVIAKVPWKSLGDPAIAWKSRENEEWYMWQALKDLIQACGRVARHEKDYGNTYILDSTVNRLLEKAKHLVPDWFRDALNAGKA
jgi:Rad3-related DNA helicase